MRVLLQRVKNANVKIPEQKIAGIGKGLLIFLGITQTDTDSDIKFLVEKIANLRIFEDEQGKMNLSIVDTKGEILIVSQFTLYADCKKGRRPSFTDAAEPKFAQEMYKKFVQKFKETGLTVKEGKFGAMMDIELVNTGPVTIWIDSKVAPLFHDDIVKCVCPE